MAIATDPVSEHGRRLGSRRTGRSRWFSPDTTSAALLEIAATYPTAAPIDWDSVASQSLLQAAEHHRVATFLSPSADAGPAPADVQQRLRLVTIRRKFAQARMSVDLEQIVRAANGLDRPWALLKGPVLVATAYDGSGREFSDIDVLVDGRDMQRMTTLLLDAGGVLLDRNFGLLSAITSGEIGIRMPSGTMVDLHWHPIHSERVRRHFRMPTADLLERTQPVELSNNMTVLGLDPTDALLYLSLHACLSGGERLLWFKDIDLVSRRLPWDEEHLLDRALRWRIGAPVGLMLQRAKVLFDTPIDPRLPRRLCTRPLLRATGAALDRCAPPHRQSRNSHDRTFYRSVRPSTTATFVELVKHTLSGQVVPSRFDSVRPWRAYQGQGVPPTSIESSPSERRKYFERVAAEARRPVA